MTKKSSQPKSDPAAAQIRIDTLQSDIMELELRLGGQNPDLIVASHISRLHTYNEIKDGAQSLISKYAMLRQTTIRAVHEELGLSLTE